MSSFEMIRDTTIGQGTIKKEKVDGARQIPSLWVKTLLEFYQESWKMLSSMLLFLKAQIVKGMKLLKTILLQVRDIKEAVEVTKDLIDSTLLVK